MKNSKSAESPISLSGFKWNHIFNRYKEVFSYIICAWLAAIWGGLWDTQTALGLDLSVCPLVSGLAHLRHRQWISRGESSADHSPCCLQYQGGLWGTQAAFSLEFSQPAPQLHGPPGTDSKPIRGTSRPVNTRDNQMTRNQYMNTRNKTQGHLTPPETSGPTTTNPEV